MSARETAAALYGLSRLVRFDPDAPSWFNASLPGFWHSFWVAVLALPVYAIQSISHYRAAEITASPLAFAVVELLTYAIGWLLYPVLMIHVTGWIDREQNYFRYMVMYNWFQLVIAGALFPLVLLNASGALTPAMTAPLFLIASAVFIVYGWYMAYRGLKVTGMTAAGIVILDMVVAFIVNGTVQVMIAT